VLAAPGAAIHARYGGEAEPAVFSVAAATTISPAAFVHFPIPVRRAWDNVVPWCATEPFHTPDDAAAWSARHGFAPGDVVPLDRVLALARVWYGRHLDPSWRKWTVDEARAMFTGIGLTSPTWDVPRPPPAGSDQRPAFPRSSAYSLPKGEIVEQVLARTCIDVQCHSKRARVAGSRERAYQVHG
jgi:hypothetical protein